MRVSKSQNQGLEATDYKGSRLVNEHLLHWTSCVQFPFCHLRMTEFNFRTFHLHLG